MRKIFALVFSVALTVGCSSENNEHVELDKPIEEMTLPELGRTFAQAECGMPSLESKGKTAKEVVDQFSSQAALAAERVRVMGHALLAAQIINAGNQDLKNTDFMKARIEMLGKECPAVVERYKQQGIPLDKLPNF
jgi:hypothetical protein